MAEYFPDILCKFGQETAQTTAISHGMNKKSGMDEVKFKKYIQNSITHLCPNACNEPGNCILIKVDGGPGRLNMELLAELWLLGFYLYPGVPNTTAVTQEKDRNYGPFKIQFRQNLGDIINVRMDKDKSVLLQAWLVGMVIFGGTNWETGFTLTECAFTQNKSKASCLNAWAKVGSATPTRSCLLDPKVSRTLGNGDGRNNKYLLSIQTVNDLATRGLSNIGYNGGLLRVKIRRARENAISLRVPHLKERLEPLMRNALTHSSKFLATRGNHLTNNNHFSAAQMNVSGKDIKEY